MRWIVAAWFFLTLVSSAFAQDLVRDSIPQKWIEPLVPEDLPELKYPAYFNDLDKAQLQTFTGRYKLALHTLRKLDKGDPIKIALVKSQALAAIGKRDEAMSIISETSIADSPDVQIAQAQLLVQLGRY